MPCAGGLEILGASTAQGPTGLFRFAVVQLYILHIINIMKAVCIGRILCINCHLRYVIEENGKKGTRGRRSKHLRDEFTETKRCWNLIENQSDLTLWRIHFVMVYGPVIRQTMLWWWPRLSSSGELLTKLLFVK